MDLANATIAVIGLGYVGLPVAVAFGRHRAVVGFDLNPARIEALRQQSGKPAETQTRYYVLSKAFPAERVLQVVRSHWGIENQLHWVLDVVFDEDAARNRKGSGPQNLAILRKLALNLLRSDQRKGSIRRKVKRAGWDNHFLISLLSQMR